MKFKQHTLKKLSQFLFISFISFFSISRGYSQIGKDLEFIIQNNPIEKHEPKEILSFKIAETSEVKILLLGMIRFYQNFISSQQNNQVTCVFTPSCSRFGFAAIKKYGPIYGTLMTADRLQRCHPFAIKYHYHINPETGKLSDSNHAVRAMRYQARL